LNAIDHFDLASLKQLLFRAHTAASKMMNFEELSVVDLLASFVATLLRGRDTCEAFVGVTVLGSVAPMLPLTGTTASRWEEVIAPWLFTISVAWFLRGQGEVRSSPASDPTEYEET
jgi:hypothetical protein